VESYLGETVTLRAPAKLTLSLQITGTRPDGFHLIDAEMIALDLADELLVRPGTGLEVVATDSGLSVEAGDDNLVSRALRLVGRDAAVQIHKRIPAGAGLGGGSADAAAILRWAGFGDLEAAAALGADIAFCVIGGRARVRGIGEIVDPLPFVERTLTLLTPPFGCSTPAVYRAWDELGAPQGGPGGNDLEQAALAVVPELAEWRDKLANLSGERPRLAGSGSTWFVEGSWPSPDTVVVKAIPGAG